MKIKTWQLWQDYYDLGFHLFHVIHIFRVVQHHKGCDIWLLVYCFVGSPVTYSISVSSGLVQFPWLSWIYYFLLTGLICSSGDPGWTFKYFRYFSKCYLIMIISIMTGTFWNVQAQRLRELYCNKEMSCWQASLWLPNLKL